MIFVLIVTDSPYTGAISAGILSLQEKGVLLVLQNKWWKEMHGGGKCFVSLNKLSINLFLLKIIVSDQSLGNKSLNHWTLLSVTSYLCEIEAEKIG